MNDWRDVLDGQADYAIVRGDALASLRALPDECIQCAVTSPPYYGLRDYGLPPSVWGGRLDCVHEWGGDVSTLKPWEVTQTIHKHREEGQQNAEGIRTARSSFCVHCDAWRGCLGLEPTPAMFLEHLVELFREVRRVLRRDGTLWVNLGDSYSGSGGNGWKQTIHDDNRSAAGQDSFSLRGATGRADDCWSLKPKDLMMMPARLAIALQEDGWYLRSEITWCLSGGTLLYVRAQKGDMPMSVKDLARLNPSTVQLWNGERWTRVVKVWENHEPGDPLEIELRSGETIGCTPEHLWPTERGLVQAKDLTVGDVLKSTRLPEPDVPRSPVALDDADIGWFVGLYLAEGCVNGKYISIASHIRETERFERVRRIAQAFDGSATFRHAGGNGATITVYGRILRAIIEEYISGSGAKSKRLSNACWRRSNVFLRGLIDGYLHGDGHWDEKTGRWRLGFTRNYYLAADMRTLCARLDVHIRLRPRFATMNGRSLPSFRGEIRFTRSGHRNERPDTEIVRIGYSKGRKFWDIEVEDEPHTFALASGVLTHNCKSSAMPESVRDRPTSATERIYLLSKSAQYFYDANAVREKAVSAVNRATFRGGGAYVNGRSFDNSGQFLPDDTGARGKETDGANLRNFWLLGPEPSAWDYCNACGRLFVGADRKAIKTRDGQRVCPCGASDWVAHYATFPTEIPRRAIKAGTSARGACRECGAPWNRDTEFSYRKHRPSGGKESRIERGNRIHDGGAGGWGSFGTNLRREVVTVGWRPSCAHDVEPVPCVTLDIFSGSATTGRVARQLGRRYIGLELSDRYANASEALLAREDRPLLDAAPLPVEQQASLFAV